MKRRKKGPQREGWGTRKDNGAEKNDKYCLVSYV